MNGGILHIRVIHSSEQAPILRRLRPDGGRRSPDAAHGSYRVARLERNDGGAGWEGDFHGYVIQRSGLLIRSRG